MLAGAPSWEQRRRGPLMKKAGKPSGFRTESMGWAFSPLRMSSFLVINVLFLFYLIHIGIVRCSSTA